MLYNYTGSKFYDLDLSSMTIFKKEVYNFITLKIMHSN